MADSYSKWVMTNAFASNSQAALNTGNKIEWVALKTSDDTHTLNDLPGFNDTTLATAKIKQTSSINSVVLNGNTVTITGLFNSAGNTADYYIKTIFLVAKYNGAEFLAGATVANTSGSAFRMPAASTTEITEFTARPQISVTNSSTISTTVDPVAAATNERVNSLETSLNSKIEDINTDKQKLWNKFADYVTKATAETITGVKTFSQTIVGSITGNAGTATKFQTARKINGTTFDGTADININANNDADIVHKSGTETVTGIKTFSQPINGALATRAATFTKFANVAVNMIAYAGHWANANTPITDSPVSQVWLSINVIPGYNATSGLIVISNYQNEEVWFTNVNLGVIKGWHRVADDIKVVHKTNDETVDGTKTFKKTIVGNITNADVAKTYLVQEFKSVDPNNVIENGRYIIAGNNMPNPVNRFYLDVIKYDNDNVKQVAYLDYDNSIYVRTKSSGNWNNWTVMVENTSTYYDSSLNGSGSENNIKVRVLNNVVYVSGYFRLTIYREFNDVVGSLTFKPKERIFFPTFVNGIKSGSAEMIIDTDGSLRFDAIKMTDGTTVIPSGTYVYLSPFSYPII